LRAADRNVLNALVLGQLPLQVELGEITEADAHIEEHQRLASTIPRSPLSSCPSAERAKKAERRGLEQQRKPMVL